MAAQKAAAKSSMTKSNTSSGFTAEERAAMRERAKELKANANKAGGRR